ncbi:hypothetical protein B2J86_10550 [Acidovorax sp. SRB_14]|uniref:hypothetical protein n=1 Tax=Acidovorax sp. SRB_14 TaxID=1962699 RepID=UPI0015670E2D|nr:hypothetical protein [Acidovorax sp. SRB_14]NMM81355.1 hypothetical protein [Acidovorax sp. SRB_14]
MHLHLRGAERRLNARDLLGIDFAVVAKAQYPGESTAQLLVTAAQLAQRLLEQIPLGDTDAAAVGARRDSTLASRHRAISPADGCSWPAV